MGQKMKFRDAIQDEVDEARVSMRERVDDVIASYADPEIGHGKEDDLLWEFIASIADRNRVMEDATEAQAKELLRLRDSDRTRWYA